jgi:hypothetical protein
MHLEGMQSPYQRMDHCGANPTAGSQTQTSQDRARHHRPIRQDLCGHADFIPVAVDKRHADMLEVFGRRIMNCRRWIGDALRA